MALWQQQEEQMALWQQQEALQFQDHLMIPVLVWIKADVHQTKPRAALSPVNFTGQEIRPRGAIEAPAMSSKTIDSHLSELSVQPIIMAAGAFCCYWPQALFFC